MANVNGLKKLEKDCTSALVCFVCLRYHSQQGSKEEKKHQISNDTKVYQSADFAIYSLTKLLHISAFLGCFHAECSEVCAKLSVAEQLI